MAKYAVNEHAVEHARRLIASRQYVLDSDWGDVQPSASTQNAYLERTRSRSTAAGISG